MNILMTASSYPASEADWRSVFIRHMAGALARQPDVSLSLYAPPGSLPEGVISAVMPGEYGWLEHLMREGGVAHLLRNRPLAGLWWAARLSWGLHLAYRRYSVADVFHVNWLQCALFVPASSRVPLLVTVLGSDFGLLRHAPVVSRLRAVFSRRPVILAPNAEWMEPRLRELFGDVATVRTVVFGVDRAWFELVRKPRPGVHRWLAVFRITRKKLGPLLEWGETLFSGRHELHLIGPMQENVDLPPWVHYHGPSNPAALHAEWFPEAAGLITLSEHDEGRPQVMLEAMASGLPVIASGLPAHATLVDDGHTGFLVNDANALSEALNRLADVDVNRQFGIHARASARERFGDWDDCAARYMALYGELGANE